MRWRIFPVAALFCAAVAAAKPVEVEHNSKAIEFSFGWSAEAAGIPALDRRFRSEMTKALREAQTNALEDEQLAREQKRPFNRHFLSVQWTTAGQSRRLLSLESETGSFEGGAHPNSNYGALLWDRRGGRAITIDSLFLRSGDLRTLTRSGYCRALDAERLKRREGENLDLPDFNACPKYSELAIGPLDTNRNGRFDAIHFVASPYVAGPYVEGEYAIAVPVTARLIAALKPEFRRSFERSVKPLPTIIG